MSKNKFAPKNPNNSERSANIYIDDIYSNYFTLDLTTGKELQNFYRMRSSKEILNNKKELFHVPFEKRERVSTARFSIAGFPCLYLGTSLEVCWFELL